MASVPGPLLQRTESKNTLRALFGSEGYVLDFKTKAWTVEVLWQDGRKDADLLSRVTYGARARLIRLSDQISVWRGSCFQEHFLTPPLSSQELEGRDSERRVHAAFSSLAQACADDLWRQFFNRATNSGIERG